MSSITNSQNKKNNGGTKRSVFGTHEWAFCNANFIDGCRHDCKYCYSKAMAIRFGRKTTTTWKYERVRQKSFEKKFRKIPGSIMFPSSHDICPDNLEWSLIFLEKLLKSGNHVLIVTKPHLECIKFICEQFVRYRNSMLFRFTIGSKDSRTLRFWEPGAPSFTERLAALKVAYYNGYQTSVSCEPMLDDKIEDVIKSVLPFVTDAIWLGKANALLSRLRINGATDIDTKRRALELTKWQSDENIAKLYEQFKKNEKIKWKESIKSVVGLRIATQKGLDI